MTILILQIAFIVLAIMQAIAGDFVMAMLTLIMAILIRIENIIKEAR